MLAIDHVRFLLADVQVTDDEIETALELLGVASFDESYEERWVLRATATLLTRKATTLSSEAGLTGVEDIRLDSGKSASALLALAAQLRAQADELDAEADETGLVRVLEFHPWGVTP